VKRERGWVRTCTFDLPPFLVIPNAVRNLKND